MNLNAKQLRALAFAAQNTGDLTVSDHAGGPGLVAAVPANNDDKTRTGWTTWGLFRPDGSYMIGATEFAPVPAWVFSPETGEVRSDVVFEHPWGTRVSEPQPLADITVTLDFDAETYVAYDASGNELARDDHEREARQLGEIELERRWAQLDADLGSVIA